MLPFPHDDIVISYYSQAVVCPMNDVHNNDALYEGGEMVLSAGFSRSNLEENGKERKWKNWEGRKCC